MGLLIEHRLWVRRLLNPTTRSKGLGSVVLVLGTALALFAATVSPLVAQDGATTGWDVDVGADPVPVPADPNPEAAGPEPGTNTTVVPRSELTAPPESAPTSQDAQKDGQVRFVALLSDGGQTIKRGLVWRIYEKSPSTRGEPKLVTTKAAASPVVPLRPGRYVVNVALGRAYLTRTISVRAGAEKMEQFVLNAGGLKLVANVDGQPAPKNSVSYDILEGEPDQSGERKTVIAKAKPGLIIRLNAGIYRVISRYGDANATVSSDVQVEAGKLTLATVSHAAARVTFKLVDRPGGEALPGIQWLIATPEGEVIKQSVGALPTHILAPGTYNVTASSASGTYQAQFAVEDGQMASVEVVMN